jgi:Predicted metal-dependent hydrolase of the TIM-barrel fold
VINLWRKAEALEITVNCMVMDDLDLVNEIIYLANKFNTLRIVIDHCLMLNTFRKTENTLNELKKLSKLPNIYAKLTSGTHGSPRIFPHEDMHDPLKKVIDLFSPERCLWGSNFPNKLWSKGTTYKENLSLFTKELGLSNYEKNSILYKTSKSLWF